MMPQNVEDPIENPVRARAESKLDLASLSAQIEREYIGLLNVLTARLSNRELAKEMLSQALLTSFEHYQAGRIGDPSRLAGYVFRVAMNHARNQRRKMDERARGDPELLQVVAEEESADSPDLQLMMRQVRSVLDALPQERDREIVKRFYLEEQDKEEICRDLKLSALHFDKVICRARQRMRSLLESAGFKKTDYLVAMLALG
jgi:RNA polymerase sigma-70 factor (ECF subfamily)